MESIYKTVLARLQERVGTLKMIDYDMGQLELLYQDQRPAVFYPLALIDIAYTHTEDLSETIQQTTARVAVKLAFESPSATDSLATKFRREAALKVFGIVAQAYAALQGFGTEKLGTFTRKQQLPDNSFPGIKVITIVFETLFVDVTANQQD